jgi:hypothetical protein
VFTSPTLHAGPADVSVLVQDQNSGKIILDTAVDLAATPSAGSDAQDDDAPSVRLSGASVLTACKIPQQQERAGR